MGRPKHKFYCFISNEANMYYRCTYDDTGNPIVKLQKDPYPVTNPTNLFNIKPEFATNRNYFGAVRAISEPLIFVGDARDILRHIDYTQNGYETIAYLTIIKYNPNYSAKLQTSGYYELYLKMRLDFLKKKDNIFTYTVNLLDISAWGVISQKDDVKYSIDCSASNPLAIRVLFDGINLRSNYIYQPPAVNTVIDDPFTNYLYLSLLNVGQDGDSFGIITKAQEQELTREQAQLYVISHPNNYFFKTFYATQATITGTYSFVGTGDGGASGLIDFYFYKSTETLPLNLLPTNRRLAAFKITGGTNIYTFQINQTLNLADGEFIIFVAVCTGQFHFTPKTLNINVSTSTVVIPTTCYCLRPLDLLKALVSRASDGKYTINSKYYSVNNKKVITCGEALRGSSIANITMSITDWFKSYDGQDFLALQQLGNDLFIEKADTVYDQSNVILDIGEITDLSLEQDIDHLVSAIQIGSKDQNYRHTSGRLEFNAESKFSITGISNIKEQFSLISPARTDGYGAEFIRLDYQTETTKDNSGDKEFFMIAITDQVGVSVTLKENFESIEVSVAPLSPIITAPLDGQTINNITPVVKGRCFAGETINIYVNGVFDGSTVSDADGNFEYNIQGNTEPYEVVDGEIVNDGVNLIEATFTDLTGIITSISVTIIDSPQQPLITYPEVNDFLYNNQPIVKGKGVAYSTVRLFLDGALLAVVTVDGNCEWQYKPYVLYNGNHGIFLDINPILHNFNVDSFTDVPLITSKLDNFPIVNDLLLVYGVSKPNETIFLYLDYYESVLLGTTTSDSSGNWSIQLVPLLRTDGTTLTPLSNGEHILSTGLTIQSAQVKTSGFTLDRPATSVSGVYDNSVINTTLTPMHMLLARSSYWASIFYQNKSKVIKFEDSSKNRAFSSTINGVTISESADVSISSLGQPLFLPIKATFKAISRETFMQILGNYSTGGVIRGYHRGNPIDFVPIGRMSISDIRKDEVNWSLLLSRNNSLFTILKLYKKGLILNLMQNQIAISDYNTLHFVGYNVVAPDKYNTKDLYDDWFEERISNWINKPPYFQKVQRNDPFVHQVTTNGISGLMLKMYRCSDGTEVDIFPYEPMSPAPISLPEVAMEATFLWGDYPADSYFFVMSIGSTNIAISQRVCTKDKWEGTLLIEATNLQNEIDTYWSNGFVSRLRVEGFKEMWQPDVDFDTAEDEIGDRSVLNSRNGKKRDIHFGDGVGMPDYMAIKLGLFMVMDNLQIEGIYYVADKENKLEPTEQIVGHPMYDYTVSLRGRANRNNNSYAGDGSHLLNSVILVIDASAFGTGNSGLQDIEITES